MQDPLIPYMLKDAEVHETRCTKNVLVQMWRCIQRIERGEHERDGDRGKNRLRQRDRKGDRESELYTHRIERSEFDVEMNGLYGTPCSHLIWSLPTLIQRVPVIKMLSHEEAKV